MSVASVVGLVLPALDEDEPAAVVAGIAVGVGFLLLARHWLGTHELSPTRLRSAGGRRALLVFLVLFVHSLPEGFAIGTAWASNREGLGLFVFLAIALQNIPEGTSVAIPMAAENFRAREQFWAAVGTSAPQPFGAVLAFLLVDEISGSFRFPSASRPERCSRSSLSSSCPRHSSAGATPPHAEAPRWAQA